MHVAGSRGGRSPFAAAPARTMPSLAEPIAALCAIADGDDDDGDGRRAGDTTPAGAAVACLRPGPRHGDRQTGGHKDRNGHSDRQASGYSDRQTGGYSDRQSNRQTCDHSDQLGHEHFYVRETTNGDRDEAEGDDYVGSGQRHLAADRRIVSSAGTVRGVRNRVRTAIETFGESDDNQRLLAVERGRLVVYTTSMTIVRDTHERCSRVRRMLQTHMAKYEERDVFMSRENQRELRQRLALDVVDVPHVFGDGVYMGGADELEALNEAGELRTILKHFKRSAVGPSCAHCGGYRYVPCRHCHGGKRSLHRAHCATEFCALRCSVCDENGLLRCSACNTAAAGGGVTAAGAARLGEVYKGDEGGAG